MNEFSTIGEMVFGIESFAAGFSFLLCVKLHDSQKAFDDLHKAKACSRGCQVTAITNTPLP